MTQLGTRRQIIVDPVVAWLVETRLGTVIRHWSLSVALYRNQCSFKNQELYKNYASGARNVGGGWSLLSNRWQSGDGRSCKAMHFFLVRFLQVSNKALLRYPSDTNIEKQTETENKKNHDKGKNDKSSRNPKSQNVVNERHVLSHAHPSYYHETIATCHADVCCFSSKMFASQEVGVRGQRR